MSASASGTPAVLAPSVHPLRDAWRAFRVLMSFSFTAAPREATLFLLCGCVMALGGPINAVGAKFLVDALFVRDTTAALTAGVLLALAAAVSLLNTLYYLRSEERRVGNE